MAYSHMSGRIVLLFLFISGVILMILGLSGVLTQSSSNDGGITPSGVTIINTQPTELPDSKYDYKHTTFYNM